MRNELMHHGIKGQKWGVRRYQNEDGSLTAEGEKRYDTKNEGEYTILVDESSNKRYALINHNGKNYKVDISEESKQEKDQKSATRGLWAGIVGLGAGIITARLLKDDLDFTNEKVKSLAKIGAGVAGTTLLGALGGTIIGEIQNSLQSSVDKKYGMSDQYRIQEAYNKIASGNSNYKPEN